MVRIDMCVMVSQWLNFFNVFGITSSFMFSYWSMQFEQRPVIIISKSVQVICVGFCVDGWTAVSRLQWTSERNDLLIASITTLIWSLFICLLLLTVIPRNEWLSRQHVGVRPTKFIVIDRLGDVYDEAIYRIEQENTIGVASTGIDVCRNGTLCWIQVCPY